MLDHQGGILKVDFFIEKLDLLFLNFHLFLSAICEEIILNQSSMNFLLGESPRLSYSFTMVIT